MKRIAQTFLGTAVLVSTLAFGQSPTTPSPQSSPSTQPGTVQRSDPSMDQMQRQSDTHMDNGAKQMMRSSDTAFAMKAAQGGMAEVKLGQLASEKGSDPDVKSFGQHMVDDHTKAGDQLKSIAKSENMTLPSDIDGKSQRTYDRLSKLSGAEFDKAYVKDMVKDHAEDVKEFQKESKTGKDEKLKGFASDTLPVIQGHLEMVKGIQAKMAGGSGSPTK